MKIYRAISADEKEDLENKGNFNPVDGQYEGKLFAESLKDAVTFGKNFFKFDQKPFYVVEVDVSDNFKFEFEYPDQALGVGATIVVDRDVLTEFNQSKTFVILEYVNI